MDLDGGAVEALDERDKELLRVGRVGEFEPDRSRCRRRAAVLDDRDADRGGGKNDDQEARFRRPGRSSPLPRSHHVRLSSGHSVNEDMIRRPRRVELGSACHDDDIACRSKAPRLDPLEDLSRHLLNRPNAVHVDRDDAPVESELS